MKNKLAISLIFLTTISGIVGFWYYQKNIYSKEILKLEIFGPETAELMEEIEYIVKYKNNGNVRLEEAELIFEYPKYSIVPENELRKEKPLDDIYPGEEKTLNFKARLFGRENEPKIAKAWLSYRPKNLKARYESETSLTTLIKKVPITFEFDLLSKIESGKEIRFRLNYFSNVNYPLSDLRVKIEYPSGFEFLESKPEALEETEWEIGLLNPAVGGRIEILGKIQGEVGESKIFWAELSQWQKGELVLLKTVSWGVEIIKPLLYIFQEINGNPKYIANPGDLLDYQISFKNIGERILENLFLMVELESEALDFDTLRVKSDLFEKIENKIIWNYTMIPELRVLPSMAEGKVEFWIQVKDNFPLDFKNPEIKTVISLDGFKEELSTKINSKLEILQKGYFEDEIFGNSGPLPPKVAETTTYTVIWQAENYYNDVKNVKVKAILPPEVKLTGKIFPEEQSSKFAFDTESREIVWEIGDLEAGRGVSDAGPVIAFQVALTPTANQRGQIATLINEAKISGEDQWTEATLETIAEAVDTTLPDDETVSEEQGIVR
ncbi:hypothetical protein KJA14_01325 [Patescibacteria group bacterium]|nr:hypothetical protein [Patescibacteria group bacterium]